MIIRISNDQRRWLNVLVPRGYEECENLRKWMRHQEAIPVIHEYRNRSNARREKNSRVRDDWRQEEEEYDKYLKLTNNNAGTS